MNVKNNYLKKSKYGNKHITIDNIKFSSIKEAKRYEELKNYQEQGKIRGLELQVKYNLQPSFKINGKTIRAIDYIADFTYTDNTTEELVVEDVKGYKTDIYKLKRKLFAYKYHKEIKETY
jgi:hypothetical protein